MGRRRRRRRAGRLRPGATGFCAYYFDFSGIQSVSLAVQNGLETYADLPPEKARSLKWREIPNITRTTPDLDGLTNGVCHLFLKARNRRGGESRVVSIPFMLDRQLLEATSARRVSSTVVPPSLSAESDWTLRVRCSRASFPTADAKSWKSFSRSP